jgi:hypothetical protein
LLFLPKNGVYTEGSPIFKFNRFNEKNMKKYFQTVSIHLSIAYAVYWSNRKNVRDLIAEINQNLEKKDSSLSDFQIKRIHQYTVFITMTSGWFATLRGQKPNTNEQILALNLGAITPFIDDLTDSLKKTSPEILKELNSTDATSNSAILAARYLLTAVRKNASEVFFRFCEQTLLTQDESLKQVGNAILGDDELAVITRNKGGASLLLYRIVLGDTLKIGEKEAIYALGDLVQLTNDLFDIYKDLQDKQQTLYTNTTDFKKAYAAYRMSYNEVNTRFCALDYDKKTIKQFLYRVSTIVSRAMVCFDQLLLTQSAKGGVLNMADWTRKELICDMEKPSNILKSLKYSTQIFKEIDVLMGGNK